MPRRSVIRSRHARALHLPKTPRATQGKPRTPTTSSQGQPHPPQGQKHTPEEQNSPSPGVSPEVVAPKGISFRKKQVWKTMFLRRAFRSIKFFRVWGLCRSTRRVRSPLMCSVSVPPDGTRVCVFVPARRRHPIHASTWLDPHLGMHLDHRLPPPAPCARFMLDNCTGLRYT